MIEIYKLLPEVDLEELLGSDESHICVLMDGNLDKMIYYSDLIIEIIAKLQHARKRGLARVPAHEVVSSIVGKLDPLHYFNILDEGKARNEVMHWIHKKLKPQGLVSVGLERGSVPMLSLGPNYESTWLYAVLSQEEYMNQSQAG